MSYYDTINGCWSSHHRLATELSVMPCQLSYWNRAISVATLIPPESRKSFCSRPSSREGVRHRQRGLSNLRSAKCHSTALVAGAVGANRKTWENPTFCLSRLIKRIFFFSRSLTSLPSLFSFFNCSQFVYLYNNAHACKVGSYILERAKIWKQFQMWL